MTPFSDLICDTSNGIHFTQMGRRSTHSFIKSLIKNIATDLICTKEDTLKHRTAPLWGQGKEVRRIGLTW